MSGLRFIVAFAIYLSIPLVSHASEDISRELAARVELHSIQTLTLSDQQFLTGDANANVVTLSGELRIPQAAGRVPAVVLLHGSAGVGANAEVWSREFNAMGIATFVLDGFTGRGLTVVSNNQGSLGRLNFTLDAYRALDVLAKHPRVDTNRIALMGFSRGGQGALYASLRRFNLMWNKSGVEFVAYVPFYPDCMTTYVSDSDTADRPIRIFHGAEDDYNPVAPCRAYVERLRQAGRDAVLTEYADTWHTFDNPLITTPWAVNAEAMTVRNCRIREERAGTLVNAATGQPWSYADPCVQRGPRQGYNPTAAAAAHKAVGDFLRAGFKLN